MTRTSPFPARAICPTAFAVGQGGAPVFVDHDDVLALSSVVIGKGASSAQRIFMVGM